MASPPGTSAYSSSILGRESTIPLQASGSSQPEPGMLTTRGESASRRAVGPRGVFVAGFKNMPPALVERPVGLPPGKYKIVGFAMDITGRKLIDEIYFLSAHSYSGKHYCRYIMIHGTLNSWARNRHHIRVLTTEFTRIFKCLVTRMVIETKSEFKALLEFLKWLESIKEADEKIILIYHEPRRLTSMMLIKAILRYNLMDYFKSIVAGFSDSFAMCHEKCGMMLKSVSLTMMAKLLLDEEFQIVDVRYDRAKVIIDILEQLAYQECEMYDEAVGGEGYYNIEKEMMELACAFGRPVNTEIEAFTAMKQLIKRQDTFRVVLIPLLSFSKEKLWFFTKMRRRMAEAGLLYEQVKDAWYHGRRRGVTNLLLPLEEIITEQEMKMLVDIFVAHFAPEGEPEPDELFWSSDAEGDESPNSPSTPSSAATTFLTAEDYLNF